MALTWGQVLWIWPWVIVAWELDLSYLELLLPGSAIVAYAIYQAMEENPRPCYWCFGGLWMVGITLAIALT